MALGYGVMVTLQILVLSFQVRILVAQQEAKIKQKANRAEHSSSALFLFYYFCFSTYGKFMGIISRF